MLTVCILCQSNNKCVNCIAYIDRCCANCIKSLGTFLKILKDCHSNRKKNCIVKNKQKTKYLYCNTVRRYKKKEPGTGKHVKHFNNNITKHKSKAAAPHGRLPHTKHK